MTVMRGCKCDIHEIPGSSEIYLILYFRQDIQRTVTIETNYVPPDPITNSHDSALTAAML